MAVAGSSEPPILAALSRLDRATTLVEDHITEVGMRFSSVVSEPMPTPETPNDKVMSQTSEMAAGLNHRCERLEEAAAKLESLLDRCEL